MDLSKINNPCLQHDSVCSLVAWISGMIILLLEQATYDVTAANGLSKAVTFGCILC